MPNLIQDYQRLTNEAIVEVTGASDALIMATLYEVFHEWFTETNSWLERITIPIVAGTTEYDLIPVEGGEFVQVINIVDTNNSPQPIISDVVGHITLRDTPNSAATWTATVAKTIGIPVDRDGKPEVPEWTISRWFPYIKAGLIGTLFMQPKKPYSNPQLGQYNLKKFRNGLGIAKSAALHGHSYGKNAWMYPQAWRTRGQQSGGSGGNDRSFGSAP